MELRSFVFVCYAYDAYQAKTFYFHREHNIVTEFACLFQTNELVAVRCSEASLSVQLEMSEGVQLEHKATIKGLEEKLERLLQGQTSEVATVMQQLKQAEQVGFTTTRNSVQ